MTADNLAAELARLREENAQLRAALAQGDRQGTHHTLVGLQDVVLLVGPDGVLQYANSRAEVIFEAPRAQLQGKPVGELVLGGVSGTTLSKLCRDATQAGKTCTVEWVDPGASPAHARFFLVSATPDAKGGVQVIITDRTGQRRAETALSRYLSPQVLEAVLKSGVDPFLARKYELTVLFADLRGFTSLSSQLPAEDVKKLIDEYLTVQIDLVLQEGATLDKIVGDEVMALFGAPLPAEGHALWAVNTALKMQAGHARLMSIWTQRGLKACPMGIGINSGTMVVGHIGSKQQMNYTVLGHNVNLGARLCSSAEGGEIVLSPRTFDLAKQQLTQNPGAAWRPLKFKRGKVLQAKGIAEPIETVSVVLS
jgi:class 3 adenylate cyclase